MPCSRLYREVQKQIRPSIVRGVWLENIEEKRNHASLESRRRFLIYSECLLFFPSARRLFLICHHSFTVCGNGTTTTLSPRPAPPCLSPSRRHGRSPPAAAAATTSWPRALTTSQPHTPITKSRPWALATSQPPLLPHTRGNETRVISAGENLSTWKDKITLPPLSTQPVPSHWKVCNWRYRIFPTVRSGRLKARDLVTGDLLNGSKSLHSLVERWKNFPVFAFFLLPKNGCCNLSGFNLIQLWHDPFLFLVCSPSMWK